MLAVAAAAALSAAAIAQNVFVVYNSSDPESADIAQFYARERNIGYQNLIALNTPKKAVVTRDEYIKNIENPLLDELTKRGALDVQELGPDPRLAGRTKRATILLKADFVVLCRGIPLKIAPSVSVKKDASGRERKITLCDYASVDSELAACLLPQNCWQNPVKNPLYGKFQNAELMRNSFVLKTARLDGITAGDAKSLVKSALQAEKLGLRGRAYVDKSKKYPYGDKMLDGAAKILAEMNFDISVDDSRELFNYTQRFDAPVLYFGWYSAHPRFYPALKNFKMPDGAMAEHIYSYSAANMSNPKNWTPAFVRAGCAWTVGNVYEPYLDFVHNPEAVAEALRKNLSAGETFYASLPTLGWNIICVGDPLFRPNLKPLDAQIADIENGFVRDRLAQYAVLRKMNEMEKTQPRSKAFEFGKKFVGKIPDTALLFRLAKMKFFEGNTDAAAELATAAENSDAGFCSSPEYMGLAFETAQLLADCGHTQKAMSIMEKLQNSSCGTEFSKTVVERAKEYAALGVELPKNIALAMEEIAALQKAEQQKKSKQKASAQSARK